MNDKTAERVPWSFWVISAVALIWNVLGGVNFLVQMNTEAVASMPETHRAIIDGRPAWATGGFAVTVLCGALGGLMLLLKRSAAYHFFIASLLGAIVTMIHTIGVARSTGDFSPAEIAVMILLPLVVAVFLIWYSKRAQRNGWIR